MNNHIYTKNFYILSHKMPLSRLGLFVLNYILSHKKALVQTRFICPHKDFSPKYYLNGLNIQNLKFKYKLVVIFIDQEKQANKITSTHYSAFYLNQQIIPYQFRKMMITMIGNLYLTFFSILSQFVISVTRDGVVSHN